MVVHRSLIMQYILKTLTRLSCFLLPFTAFTQSSLIPRGSKHEHFLNRMEILLRDNNDLNVSTLKPLSRRLGVGSSEVADSLHNFYPYDYFYHLSKIDRHNLRSLLMNNREWVQSSKDSFASRKPFLKAFYKDKANFLAVEEKDFFLAVNPVLQLQQSFETENSDRVFVNSKGVSIAGDDWKANWI